MSEEEEFCSVDCNECGITFKFTTTIEKMWRKSSKTFFCPNGHSLHWPKQTETEEQKELKKLRAEVTSLKDKLTAAEKTVETQKKRIDELIIEVETWKPTSIEDKVG
jgi:seryl-tRNA synthetase